MNLEWIHHPISQTALAILLLILLSYVFQRIFIFIYGHFIRTFIKENDTHFSFFLFDKKFILWLTLIPTPIYLFYGIETVPNISEHALDIIRRFIIVFLIITSLRTLSHFLRISDAVYRTYEVSSARPIKGYLQSISLVAHFIGIISMVAILFNKSPLVFLSGLGALTAILLLIFKDSILSLVAGIQITTNDLIRVGDWIEIPQFNADGAVIDIALHTVKVQNWDKTITVIPAHKFLENSFKNWRGMQESGGRRIKRSVLIDVQSIRFLDDKDIEKFRRSRLLKKYIEDKLTDIASYNDQFAEDEKINPTNARKLTNIGTFRNYLSFYLRNNPHIHKEHTFLVRQLEVRPEGLPIEIYVFTNDVRWANYETIQADVFDHVFAILAEFDLKAFQKPSGNDFKNFYFK